MWGVDCCAQPGAETVNRDDVMSAANLSADESLMVREMNALSVKERETVYEELHGVADIMPESPDLINKRLNEMRQAIKALPTAQRKAYNRAIFLRPSLENDQMLQLLFLRCHRFDAEKAALHMCRSFDHKLKLFGEEKLAKRRITLEDLSERERTTIMHSAAMQMLPSTDSSGRGIFLAILPNFAIEEDWLSLARYTWYQIYTSVEGNDELQKRGVVQVVSTLGEWNARKYQQTLEYLIFSAEFAGDWPLRLCGHHYCYDQKALYRAGVAMQSVRGQNFRVRNRLHFGSRMEIQYKLMSFGIDLQNGLNAGQGLLSVGYVERYLERRRCIEAELESRDNELLSSMSAAALYPESNDVLMGKGRPFMLWPGNFRLPLLIAPHLERYMKMEGTHSGKAGIALEVVEKIRQEGGRFLQRSANGYWEEADERKVKEKISQIFRAEIRRARDLNKAEALFGPMVKVRSLSDDRLNSDIFGRKAAKRARILDFHDDAF